MGQLLEERPGTTLDRGSPPLTSTHPHKKNSSSNIGSIIKRIAKNSNDVNEWRWLHRRLDRQRSKSADSLPSSATETISSLLTTYANNNNNNNNNNENNGSNVQNNSFHEVHILVDECSSCHGSEESNSPRHETLQRSTNTIGLATSPSDRLSRSPEIHDLSSSLSNRLSRSPEDNDLSGSQSSRLSRSPGSHDLSESPPNRLFRSPDISDLSSSPSSMRGQLSDRTNTLSSSPRHLRRSSPVYLGVYDLLPRRLASVYHSADTVVRSTNSCSDCSSPAYSKSSRTSSRAASRASSNAELFAQYNGSDMEYGGESDEEDGCIYMKERRASELKGADGSSELTLSNVFQDKAENFVMAALFCASEEGNVDGLKELSEMAANVDLNTANKHGETAVHMAASGGHVDVLKFLLNKGVDISIKDKQGDSAVYWAARQGHTEIIKCLVEAGVPINTQNKSGETALHVAARYGHTSAVEYLCSIDANINLFDNLGETPLHCAAWHGYVQIVRCLCENGAMLSLQNKEKETALHCASVRGNLDCVRVLLEYRAPLNVTDKRGSTALHLACQRHNTAIALHILNAGCKLDIIDKETGESALHIAAKEGLLSVVQTMCSLGAKIDQLTEDGLTPLHLACKSGHIEIARCLLLVGADPDIANKDGVSGEIMALAQGYTNIAELMNNVKGEKRQALISQLKLSSHPISRIKLKLLGSTGVGKTTLVESLKCGFLGSFFRRRAHPHGASIKQKTRSKLSRQFSLPTPLNYTVGNPTYTKGIDVHNLTISGSGDWSVWDFSGYEPYYMLYDHFMGDVNCVHMVMFNLEDSLDEQMAQVVFWLNFLKARIHPKMPIDYCGKLQNTARVMLVASHSDKASSPCHKTSAGHHINEDAQYILDRVLTMFKYDLDICPQVFVLDTQVSSSADMRAVKHQLAKFRKDMLESLPCTNGFLSAVVAQLPEWRKALQSYPVLSWTQFSEYVRSCVNPLASDDDVKLLDRQLQLMGEIVYIHGQTDLVIINPRWLGVEVLGTIMSHERIAQARLTGCFSLEEFQLMYPNSDALSLLQVLEALEMCTPCEVDGDVEYEFPCLNFVEELEGLWLKDEKHFPLAVYGGVRLHTSFQSGAQLKYLFPRIQVCLRRSILSSEDEEEAESSGEEDEHRVKHEQKDADLYQWHHGSKYCCARLEGIIDMDRNEQFLEIKVRGPAGERANLYYFLEDFVNIVEQVVENVCPGLCVERYTLSPSQLREHGKVVRSYSPTELLRMQLENRSSVVLSGNTKEDFIDIACLGSEEILETVTLGMDLPISHLTIHTQRLLSYLLDPPEAMGKDWCLLAVSLGLSDALPSLESPDTEEHRISPTQKVLNEWTRRHPDASIRQLIYRLREINRLDAVEAILRTGPPFKVLSFEDQLTDSGTHGTNASTNTLSNLSR